MWVFYQPRRLPATLWQVLVSMKRTEYADLSDAGVSGNSGCQDKINKIEADEGV